MLPKFVADESVDFRLVQAFREMGFDVYPISEVNPSINDDEVLKIAG